MAFESILLMTFACIAIIYLYCNIRRLVSIKMVKNVPGPKALPLVGSALSFIRKNLRDVVGPTFEFARDYSSPFQVWMGNKLFIGIYEPDQIKAILLSNSCLDKSVAYELLIKPVLGKTSLVTSPASIWKKHRKILVSSFSSNMLRSFFDIFVEHSIILTEKLKTIGLDGNEIELFESIFQCTMAIACETVIGAKWDLRSDKINQICDAIIRGKRNFGCRLQNMFLYFNVIYNLTDSGREQQKLLNFTYSFVDEVIQQRQYALNKSETDQNKITRKAICDMLLEKSNKETFTQEDIHDNVLTMLLAAGDTTAITMNFAIFMLANYPEIQEKAYKELLGLYGVENPRSAPIKYEDLQHMEFLDCVIKETTRLFPSVPVIARQLTEDLRMGEIILPKGADVVLSLSTMHRNEKYWPNPLMFDPDRFLPERLRNSGSDYYLPFSFGSRNCIGMKYAMISMKVILATLIRTFVFKVDKSTTIDKIKLKSEVLLTPVRPLKVKIEKRSFLL